MGWQIYTYLGYCAIPIFFLHNAKSGVIALNGANNSVNRFSGLLSRLEFILTFKNNRAKRAAAKNRKIRSYSVACELQDG
jgi:hypothetical protein